MKKLLALFIAAGLTLSLAGCGGGLVDLNTEKSKELSAQYDYYGDSSNTLRAKMEITPEQADEVFVVLISCGLDQKITNVIDGTNAKYNVWFGSNSLDVVMKDGVVESVTGSGDLLYPESEVKAQEDAKAAEDEAEKENAKAAAILIDGQAFQIILNSEEIVALLQQGVDAFSDGGGSALDLYDLAKTAKESQFNLDSSLSDLKDEHNKKYIDACRAYVVNGQIFADKLMKYLDEDKLEYLSEAKECIADSDAYILSVIAERSAYLSEQGVSDEEISSILQSESAPTE